MAYGTPWTFTQSEHTWKVNIFDMRPGKERHIGTLTSGSASKTIRFSEDIQLIAAAPALLDALNYIGDFLSGRTYLDPHELDFLRSITRVCAAYCDAPIKTEDKRHQLSQPKIKVYFPVALE